MSILALPPVAVTAGTTTTSPLSGADETLAAPAIDDAIASGGGPPSIASPEPPDESGVEAVLFARLFAGAPGDARPNRGSVRSELAHLANGVRRELKALAREVGADAGTRKELRAIAKELQSDLSETFKSATGVGEGSPAIDAEALASRVRSAADAVLDRAATVLGAPAAPAEEPVAATEPVAVTETPAEPGDDPLARLASLFEDALARLAELFSSVASSAAGGSADAGTAFSVELQLYARISVIDGSAAEPAEVDATT